MFKYKRYFDLSIQLNPFSWGGWDYYRYDWKNGFAKTSREGRVSFGPISFSWMRDPKGRA